MITPLSVRVVGVLLSVCALSSFAAGPSAPGKTTAKSSAPDIEFLEYLGTLESDEENWTDIANVDVRPHDAAGKNGGKSNSGGSGANTGNGGGSRAETKAKPKADDPNQSARNDK